MKAAKFVLRFPSRLWPVLCMAAVTTACSPEAPAPQAAATPAAQPAPQADAQPAAPAAAPTVATAPAPALAPAPVAAPSPAPLQPAAPVVPPPPVQTAQTPPPKKPVCHTCGVVQAVQPVSVKGESSGLGTVAGAVVGGVLGNQIGGGSGRTVATVAGAVGGGLAGREVERRNNATTQYQTTVRMNDGRHEMVTTEQPFAIGAKVRLEQGELRLANKQ